MSSLEETNGENTGEEQKDEMNAAETLVKAIDDITELFVEESNLIEDGKISP